MNFATLGKTKFSSGFKHLILVIVLLGSGTASAMPVFELLRDREGNAVWLDKWEATGFSIWTRKKEKPDACEAAGKGRLPTVRELTELIRSRGAAGIIEKADANVSGVPPGFQLMNMTNPNGTFDWFYFNRAGYVPPEGDILSYWASSYNKTDEFLAVFFFEAQFGTIRTVSGSDHWDVGKSVLCVRP